ncbi:MAG TPA: molybdopterin-dependent oxidoreductase [Polyangia bacterium]|nr:molybdopterin-dependent oxidoreductase [Polyangia bacterium]
MSEIVLTIDGPSTCTQPALTWRDVDALAKHALVEHTETLSAKVRGEGVRLLPLLERARFRSGATHVIVHGGGDYRACLTIAECESAVMAHRLDGAPLPAELGGPLRLLVPSSSNTCLSVKGVHHIVITDRSEPDTVPTPTSQIRKRT